MTQLGNNFIEEITTMRGFFAAAPPPIVSTQLARGDARGAYPRGRYRLLHFWQARVLFGMLGVVVLTLLLSCASVFDLQVIRGKQYYLQSEENRIRVKRILPERGVVYDRDGEGYWHGIAPGFAVGIDLTGRDALALAPTVTQVAQLVRPLSYRS